MKKCTATAKEGVFMKLFVTGVAGQLGHDVMNELDKRGYEGVGSDLAPEYSGIQTVQHVTTMPYMFYGYHRCCCCGKSHYRSRCGRRGTLCSMDSCRCS